MNPEENPQILCTKFKDITISTARNIFSRNRFETIVMQGSNRIYYATFGNELDAVKYHIRRLDELYFMEVEQLL